ncbi:MAG: hypothetical protein JWM91_4255 [Rhodospirillales bacterium]|nr:hypothetical protein [Rhodospirillales bacterium]
MRQRGAIMAIGAIAVLATLALLVPTAIRGISHRGLAALGFTDSHGGSVSISLHHIRIADIAIGQKSSATVTVTFSAGGLIRGRLNTIDLTDTALHGVMALNGVMTLDGFTSFPSSTGPAKPIALPASRVTIDGLSLELETPAGKSTVTAAGLITASDAGLHLTGSINLARGEMTGTAPADFTLSPTGWSLSLSPIHIAFPAKIDVANTVEGHITFSKPAGAAVTGEGRLDGTNLTIAMIPVRKLKLNFETGADGQSASLQLIPTDGGAGLDGNLKNDGTGLTATVKARFAEIGAIAKVFGGAAIAGPLQADLSLRMGAAAGPRPITLSLTYDGAAPVGIVLRHAALTGIGNFDATANAVTLTSCGAFSAESVTIATLVLNKLAGCLGPADGPALFTQDRSGKISLSGVFRTVAASVSSATGTLAEVAVGSLAAALQIADGQVAGFSVKADGGAIGVPALEAGVRDLVVQGASAADGSVSGAVTAGFAAAAPKSPILPITGTFGGSIANGMSLALTAGSADRLPIVKATVNGQSAKLAMAATTLGEGGADLISLIPGLATTVSKLSGNLALDATIDWSGPTPISRGSITFKDVGATTPNFTMEGLDAAITLTSLKPLTTAENQSLTMKKLLVGVPLTDGRITFGLDKHNVLNIADAGWTIAGGTVGTRDQHLDLYGPDQNLGVVVKGVDLAQLLVLVNVGGLSAQGTLEGAIPLRHIKDTILVEHGFLQTSAAGLIRYDPADTPSFLQGQPGEGTTILRDALKDFHYERLSITIDGTLGEEEKIKMSLQGANPAVYGGSAIALNLNLSGALDSIARSSVEAYTHPAETVRRKLQKKAKDKK